MQRPWQNSTGRNIRTMDEDAEKAKHREEVDRETCCRATPAGERCDRAAIIVLKMYTNEGPAFLPACLEHMQIVSAFVDRLVQGMVMGEFSTQGEC